MRAPIFMLLLLVAVGPAAAQTQPLPPYKVVSEDAGEARRIIAVRLGARVLEPDLERIAEAVRKTPKSGEQRTLVNFYLPGMGLNEACWASATFAPNLKIAINGLSLEEEQAYRAELAADKRTIVGVWLTQAPAVPGRLLIFREKGKTFADWKLRGGHHTVEEVVESRGNHGRRFDIVVEPAPYYVMTSSGALELREKKSLIAVAERVSIEKVDPKKAKPQAATNAALAQRAQAATVLAAGAAAIAKAKPDDREGAAPAAKAVAGEPAPAATASISPPAKALPAPSGLGAATEPPPAAPHPAKTAKASKPVKKKVARSAPVQKRPASQIAVSPLYRNYSN